MPALQKNASRSGVAEGSGRRPRRARRRLHDDAAGVVRRPPPGIGALEGPQRRSPGEMLAMQRLLGNRAVQRYIDGTRSNVIHRCGPVSCNCPADKKLQFEREDEAVSRLVQRFPDLADLGLGGGIIPSLEDLPLSEIVDQFAPTTGSSAPNPSCTPDFCAPLPSRLQAEALKHAAAGPILAGIAAAVNTRVVGLWSQHIFGGAAPQDLSGQFGADFAASTTTSRITDDLVEELRKSIEASPPSFPPGVDEVTVDIASRIPGAIAAIDNPADAAHVMDFDVIGEIPGNIAGGVGKNQASTPVGAMPAPFDDSRTAGGTATVRKNPDGTLTVTPNITFTVKDTIDLCPGNCGAVVEQTATRPLSWLEASGVSGDVPFTVEFPAPARSVTVTPVSPPPPPPTPAGPIEGDVRASPRLRIREAPTTASAIVGRYPDGTRITIECQVKGEMIDGNDTWDKTDRGYVSDRYVKRIGPDAPPTC